jgi:hypothetical protein
MIVVVVVVVVRNALEVDAQGYSAGQFQDGNILVPPFLILENILFIGKKQKESTQLDVINEMALKSKRIPHSRADPNGQYQNVMLQRNVLRRLRGQGWQDHWIDWGLAL